MRFDDYVAARRRRLVEHAVELGVDEDAAAALVEGVLERAPSPGGAGTRSRPRGLRRRGPAVAPASWGGLLDALAAVFAAPARRDTSTPQLVVRSATPPARECGSAPDTGEVIDAVVVRTADYDAISTWS